MSRRSRPSEPSEPITARVTVVPGLEEVLAAELVRLGFAPEIDHGGVEVRTDLQGVLTLGVQLRTGNRVVVRVATVGAASLDQLAERVRKLPWKRWVWPGQPIEVKATCSQSRLRVASNVARKVELAVRDSLKGPRLPGPRPPREPLGVQVRVVDDRATISVDASGELLHLRGWRRDAVAAPLRETLAAALLDLAGWRPDVPLVDPMCGSGTFAIEAARFAAGIPAGGSRSHAAERFPAVTAAMVKAARARGPRPAGPRAPILAADRDEAAIAATRANARRAGVSDRIEVVRCPFSELEAPPTPGLVVANPPYGKRLRSDPAEVYRKLGRTLRDDWRGWRVGVLVPSGRASWLGLPGDVRATFSNGGIRVDWVVVPPLG